MNTPYKRPQPGETEEDILQQEREFLRQIHKDKEQKIPGKHGSETKLNARPTAAEALKQYYENRSKTSRSDKNEGFLGTQEHLNESCLDLDTLEVKERNADQEIRFKVPLKKKVSLFARSRQKIGPNPENPDPRSSSSLLITKNNLNNDDKCDPIIGDQIHPLLAGMTEAEILAEQKKLIEKMDPKLVEFIRSMRSKDNNSTERNIISQDTMDTSNNLPPQNYNNLLPIDPDSVKTFPHMNRLESEKLSWTMSSTIVNSEHTESQSGQGQGCSPRFGFNGEIITEDQEKDETWSQGLHHHGEDMQRPGYTLEELLILGRSMNAGQRAMAFEALAGVFANGHDGMFDAILDRSIFQLCLNMDIIYVIRKGIDHTDSQTINSSLHCLGNLLYSEREEMALDTVHTWSNYRPEPWIQIEFENYEDDNEKKIKPLDDDECSDEDHQEASRDLIGFLLKRSCLLERFEYLLKSKTNRLAATAILNILKVLIRISRHSPEQLLQHQALLDYFVQHNLRMCPRSLQSQQLDGIPMPFVLKLFRILISSNKENAVVLFSRYKSALLPAIQLNLECSTEMRLQNIPQIELLMQQNLLIWRCIVELGFGLDAYSSISPVVYGFLYSYSRNDVLTAFDLNHCSLLLGLIVAILKEGTELDKNGHVLELSKLTESLMIKTFGILGEEHLVNQVDLDASMAVLQHGLELFTIFETLPNRSSFPCIVKPVRKFIESKTFHKAMQNLMKLSLVLKKPTPIPMKNEFERYPHNLKFTEAVLPSGELNPILRQGTPFAFLTSLIRYIKIKSEFDQGEVMLNGPIMNYLHKLKTSLYLSRSSNYYLKFELYCIYELLDYRKTNLDLYAEISYKLCSIVQLGNEDLSKLYLNQFINSFESILPRTEMKELCNLYRELVEPDQKQHSMDTNFQLWNKKLLPADWLTQPLQAVHLALKNTGTGTSHFSNISRTIVLSVLRFLQVCISSNTVNLAPKKSDYVNLYERICQCFLMSPEVFLYKPIRDCLAGIFPYFKTHEFLADGAGLVTDPDKTDDVNVIGIETPFQAFYSELVREYSGCSYGDEVFTAYVLLPLPLRVQESGTIAQRLRNINY